MKVLFIGEGLTDYVVQKLNKLNQLPEMEVFNVVDIRGAGHVGVATNQTREGVNFTVVELAGSVSRRWSDKSYWNYKGLGESLQEIKPQVVMVSRKYVSIFIYDEEVKKIVKAQRIKIILNDNPDKWEEYEVRRQKILDGGYRNEYTPWYALYLVSLCTKLGIPEATAQYFFLRVLGFLGLYNVAKIRRVLLERLEERKRILSFVDAHVSYVERAIELYSTYGVPKEKVFVKYNSPDTDILFDIRKKIENEPPILPPNAHRLLHLSRLVPVKRVDLIIEAMGILKSEFPDIELVVVGRGPETEALKNLAKHLGVEDSIRFLGWVDYEGVGKYLLASTIYVLAGHGGLSINDAMAFGKPVICSHAPDGTEKHLVFEGYNGMYFREGDKNDLAEKIRFLFRDPALIGEMGKHSTEIIKEKVNIHTVIRGYKAAWSYVLAKRS